MYYHMVKFTNKIYIHTTQDFQRMFYRRSRDIGRYLDAEYSLEVCAI